MARNSKSMSLPATLLGPGSWRGCWLVLCGLLIVAEASSAPTWLTIGHGWALVREVREVTVEAAESELVLEGIPAGADLSSLLIKTRAFPADLVQWKRVMEPADVSPSWLVASNGLSWKRADDASNAPPRVSSEQVVCVIRSARIPNELTIEVAYTLRDMDWDAFYQIAVRGDREDEMEPVSVDLYGMARIRNGSPRSFTNAVVRLVGAVTSPPEELRAPPPGFLWLNEDNPLSDMWRDPVVDDSVEQSYVLPAGVALPARAATDTVLADVRRKSAERMYSMRSEFFPQDDAGPLRPLSKQIVLVNDKAHGLGFALPPGPVEIYLGGQRTYRLQRAWFAHTPPGGRIRIDLGPAADVVGRRRAAGVSPVAVGAYESDFEILVSNRRANDIRVEISEQPSVGLGWSVLRTGKPYEMVARRLLFTPEIKAGEDLLIDYRLNVQRPRL